MIGFIAGVIAVVVVEVAYHYLKMKLPEFLQTNFNI